MIVIICNRYNRYTANLECGDVVCRRFFRIVSSSGERSSGECAVVDRLPPELNMETSINQLLNIIISSSIMNEFIVNR